MYSIRNLSPIFSISAQYLVKREGGEAVENLCCTVQYVRAGYMYILYVSLKDYEINILKYLGGGDIGRFIEVWLDLCPFSAHLSVGAEKCPKIRPFFAQIRPGFVFLNLYSSAWRGFFSRQHTISKVKRQNQDNYIYCTYTTL
jgi:hypothetical protein